MRFPLTSTFNRYLFVRNQRRAARLVSAQQISPPGGDQGREVSGPWRSLPRPNIGLSDISDCRSGVIPLRAEQRFDSGLFQQHSTAGRPLAFNRHLFSHC